jgi:hypothetical protein
MANYDVFNGDADGLCSLVQLRNAEPRESTLITGVKRDINLLKQVNASEGDQITVLDISMDKNSEALGSVLSAGAKVLYIDHHQPGDIPNHPALTAVIDEAPTICTALLVNKHLNNAFPLWAVTGAFGDNLRDSALNLGRELELKDDILKQLENLGVYINYNGYGSNLEDLHFHPRELYLAISPYGNPLDFVSDGREAFQKLESGYHEDMANASALKPDTATDSSAVFILPNEPWSRRVSGVFGNSLANDFPTRAHAIVSEGKDGTLVISVRAPLSNRTGAGDLCKRFPTGGGRAGAAGINHLPPDMLAEFVDAFTEQYSN